jgi:hypothetical protein
MSAIEMGQHYGKNESSVSCEIKLAKLFLYCIDYIFTLVVVSFAGNLVN